MRKLESSQQRAAEADRAVMAYLGKEDTKSDLIVEDTKSDPQLLEE